MPNFTITLSAGAAVRLKALVDRYNADQGTAHTVAEFLIINAKEMLIADDIAAAHQALQKQAQEDAQAALLAERQRLIDAL